MADNPPNKDFGKRRVRLPEPLPLPAKEPVKRSGHVGGLGTQDKPAFPNAVVRMEDRKSVV